MGQILKGCIGVLAVAALVMHSVAWATQAPIILMPIRSMALGGVQTTLLYDEHALYANPANLSEIHQGELKYLGVNVGATTYTLQKASEIIAAVANVTSSDYSPVAAFLGAELSTRVGLQPILTYVDNGMGFGLFSQARLKFQLTGNFPPDIKVDALVDNVAVLGKSFQLLGPFTAGVSVKYLYRASSWDLNNSATELTLGLLDYQSAGISYLLGGAVGYDVGLNTDVSLPFGNLKVAVVGQNLGMTFAGTATNATSNVSTTITDTIPMRGIVGGAMKADFQGLPMIGPLLGGMTTVAADYEFISQDTSVFKKIHMGVEHRFMNGWTLRSGFNQGNWVAGFGLRLLLFNLDYAYYVEELGSEIGLNRVANHVVELNIQL